MNESQTDREQTLIEWCEKLPNTHRVNKELKKLRETIGLLNSMLLCGETHSETSTKIVADSVAILKNVSVFSSDGEENK